MPVSRPSLSVHLQETGAPDTLRHLILEVARACKYIHYALRTTEAGLAGTFNQYGDAQVKLDVISNDIIARHLHESRLVASFISEEEQSVIELRDDAPYSVVFDPLDGSSVVDTNFTVGTIVGIYAGKELIGRTPREQVGALYVLYGPRTLLVYSTGNGVHEFILDEMGEFILLHGFLGIGDNPKSYSVGNLVATKENAAYRTLVEGWMQSGLTLRYTGCMVTDIHHVLSKGNGIFVNIGGGKYPHGKLRLVFECGPFAYLVEQAGGMASTGKAPILDVKIESIDQRTNIIVGSMKEVERVCGLLN